MLKAYSIFDDKGEIFNVPFFKTTDGLALRDFADLCSDSRSTVARHPEDYHLYVIGEFEETSGKMTAYDTPTFLAHALTMIPSVQPPEVVE